MCDACFEGMFLVTSLLSISHNVSDALLRASLVVSHVAFSPVDLRPIFVDNTVSDQCR